jgi:hypothetical protein
MTAQMWPTADLDAPTTEIQAFAGDLDDYIGRHRLHEPEPESEFLVGFPEAAAEHTAELAAIAAEPAGVVARVVRWFARNLTGTRVTALAGTVGVLVGTGIGWWVR